MATSIEIYWAASAPVLAALLGLSLGNLASRRAGHPIDHDYCDACCLILCGIWIWIGALAVVPHLP
jgi:hypothetical protein